MPPQSVAEPFSELHRTSVMFDGFDVAAVVEQMMAEHGAGDDDV